MSEAKHRSIEESGAEVTAWEPPLRLVYEEREWMEGAPLATEMIVRGARRRSTRTAAAASRSSAAGTRWSAPPARRRRWRRARAPGLEAWMARRFPRE
jgi:hypothetical protein